MAAAVLAALPARGRCKGALQCALTLARSLVVLGAAACAAEGTKPSGIVQAPDSADQVLTGFSHYVTREGVRRSHLEADSALFFEGNETTTLRRLTMTFYDDHGADASVLTAQRGVYRWQDGSMDAEGSVVVTTADGRVLKTERLRYDDAAKLIATDVPFTFDRGAEHLEGTSFRSDPDFKNVVTAKPRGRSNKGILLPGE